MCAAAAKSAAIRTPRMRPSTKKFDVVVDGQAGTLALGEGAFEYRREGTETGQEQTIERSFSITPAGPGIFSVLMDGRSYSVEPSGNGSVRVNGRIFPVEIFDPRAMRARRGPGLNDGPQTITAPMPGKVVRVLVEAGAQVECGQGLIVVEAMKMQNEVKSPKAGRVASVKAAAGATVAAGEALLIVE